jgi:MFS family permease
MAIFNGLTMANMTSVISNLAGKESQGEMMGISQSLQALGMTIPPIIAGIIVSFWVALPIVMSSILVLSAGIVFVIMFHLSRTKFRDVS